MSSDFGEMASRVNKLSRDLSEGYSRATRKALRQMISEIQLELRRNDSVAREVLVNDVRYEDTPIDSPSGDLTAQGAVSMPDWARYLEHGTGIKGRFDPQPFHQDYKAPDPGPPFQKILNWVLAKNIQPREYDTRIGLASALVDAIAEQGTFPHPFYRPVWYSNRRGYRSIVDENHEALRSALRRL